MKRLMICILALFALFGCVHYDEELWLHRDGSGRAMLRLIHRSPYENPEEILRKAELPGISLQGYNVQRNGQDVIYDIVFKFKSIEAFNNVNDQLGSADFWGKITLNKESGRALPTNAVSPWAVRKKVMIWKSFSVKCTPSPRLDL